jgi:hypothetical protein
MNVAEEEHGYGRNNVCLWEGEEELMKFGQNVIHLGRNTSG